LGEKKVIHKLNYKDIDKHVCIVSISVYVKSSTIVYFIFTNTINQRKGEK